MISKAICVMSGKTANGIVHFSQDASDGPTRITGEIKGLTPGKHGFHVHEYGDMSKGCDSAGEHFNPTGQPHGGRDDKIRHAGDLGNIEADSNGVAKFDITDNMFTLNGPYSIIGRGMVVHDLEDDLGRKDTEESKRTGSSGPRAACGIIGVAKA